MSLTWRMSRPPLCDKKVANEKLQTGYPLHRENRKNGQKIPVRENTGNLEIVPKHREFGLLKL